MINSDQEANAHGMASWNQLKKFIYHLLIYMLQPYQLFAAAPTISAYGHTAGAAGMPKIDVDNIEIFKIVKLFDFDKYTS